MLSHLLFWQHAELSGRCKDLNKLRMLFFFFQESVKSWGISLRLLVMQTLYISSIFSFLIEQYFIDPVENILTLFQSF